MLFLTTTGGLGRIGAGRILSPYGNRHFGPAIRGHKEVQATALTGRTM